MIGQRVGSYVIESQLGMGGMGAVYRARHAMLGRAAAIKILLPQFSTNADIVQRFFNEARAATEIRHMGIVEIFDFGQMEDGAAYIAMELLDGESLNTRMRRGAIGIVASLRIIRQMCGPLGAAHDRGIVHRDLKPDNVFVVPDEEVAGGERVKLLDFGIAKVLDANARQTTTGAIMGTPMYMAPEQCRGVPIDHRADLYALGCILFELVRQRTPFVGEGVGDIMGGHMFQPPPPLGSTLPELDALVARMLAKLPADRPQTSREIAEALDRILARGSAIELQATSMQMPSTTSSTSLVPSSSPGVVPRTTLSVGTGALSAPPTKKRSRWALAAFAMVAIGGVVATVIATRGSSDTSGSDVSAAQTSPLDANVVTPDAAAPDVAAAVVAVDAAVVASAPPDAAPVLTTTEPPREPEKKLYRVTIRSVPAGASVAVAGKVVGVTPFTKSYAPGTYSFTLGHSGFVDKVVVVNAASGSPPVVKLVATRTTDKPDRPNPQRGSDDAVNPFGSGN